MPADARRVKDLFVAALDLPDAAGRAAFLDRECAADPDLRRRLAALLRAHDNPASVVDRPLVPPPAGDRTGEYAPEEPTATFGDANETADHTPRPGAGTVLGGRYKLVEEIGEGGMGSVWVAQQTEPVKRVVAVKLIKAGMDSRAVLARFEAERQALALMDHPNIARVLDGGTAPDGRPFFVMELVKGTPITAYCDARRLTLRERLELFIPVCQAIQHAHLKGVIHRDIKPSNVLIALYDDKPVPKVIDFGIAKATGQALTDKTLLTGFGAVVGTPEYMSPEQASLNNLDIDTRSDVYALGVLLYELLAGSPPFRSEELKKAGLLEMLRVVREVEPSRPSAKLSTAVTLPSISAARGTEPKKLAGLLRGELDWIVMKSLEKDRGRRYESASSFAVDVQRYLAGEAVQAHPPSAAYRLRKFARKNRLALSTVAAFAGLLITAAVVTGWLALKAKQAEAEANENAATARQAESRAEGNQQRAEANAKAANKAAQETIKEKEKSDLRALSLHVDLDLAELKTDPRMGLLRLAKPLNDHGAARHVRATDVETGEVLEGVMVTDYKNFPEFRALREFVTASVLANGQYYASLLPPFTHDGSDVARFQKISPDGRTVLTCGDAGTARLWDTLSGKSLAILREKNERVVDCGFSPDGRTIYTDDDTDTLRFWDAPQGAFRTRAKPRPYVLPKADRLDSSISVGNDRVLQVIKVNHRVGREIFTEEAATTVIELWDTKTGGLVAQLNAPGRFDVKREGNRGGHYLFARLAGDGQWVVLGAGGSSVSVFSAADGRVLARLDLGTRVDFPTLKVSTAGGLLAVASYDNASNHFHLWDTTTWRLKTRVVTSRLGNGLAELGFVAEDAFGVYAGSGFDRHPFSVYQYGKEQPIVLQTGLLKTQTGAFRVDGLSASRDGQVFDAKTWQRHRPPPGKKYHPGLARFALSGRVVWLVKDSGYELVDLTTEKPILTEAFDLREPTKLFPVPGGLISDSGILIPTTRLDVPPDLLELWAQVAVRGELGPDGEFVKWDEQKWEKKRQELASTKPPHPDLPFPGYVATDKLHWLRANFNDTNNAADKLRLARDLLGRAEELGDRNEATRWRREIERRIPEVAPPPREVKR